VRLKVVPKLGKVKPMEKSCKRRLALSYVCLEVTSRLGKG